MRCAAGEQGQLDPGVAHGQVHSLALVLDLEHVDPLCRERRQEEAELSGPVRVSVLRRTDLKSAVLVFHPDGRRLATSGDPDTTRAALWDHTALNRLRADPAAAACAITGGGFTAEEWEAYIPETPYRPTCA